MVRDVNSIYSSNLATAPYNFVPLPKQVFIVEDGIEVNGTKICPWKKNDQFVDGTRSGWIDLTITTLTPLFIRGSEIKKGMVWDKRDVRLRSEPFTSPDGRPMIPGPSIRGMIRTLVEVLSFSKITLVTDQKPFFRSLAADRIGKAYRNRMIRGNHKPDGGYIMRSGNRYTIVPAKEVLRVHRDLLNKLDLNIPSKPHPNYLPDWEGQHKQCWFKRHDRNTWKVVEISLRKTNDWEKGTLVLTGIAPKKKYEFVFVGKDETKSIPIPEEIWRRFHDEDQITQWQEKAFPKDKPTRGCRKAKGHLRVDEPVFYITDESVKNDKNPAGLVFFGRAQMFRFPYDLSPLDLVPEHMKSAELDMASALFGMVAPKANNKHQSIKSRVFFERALATGGGPDWFEQTMVPKVLASPRATCFQHYLTQDGTRRIQELTTYLKDDFTTIRGHKLFWHRWDDSQGIHAVKEQNGHDSLLRDLESIDPEDTQHTVVTPIKSGVRFSGRIRFENLADIELGAILSALKLPNGYAQRLGMGKPYGLGSVKIDAKLSLVDRKARYGSWQESGVSEANEVEFMRLFENAMIEHARNTQETIDENMDGLLKICRLQSLFHILNWSGRPLRSKTDYMELESFKFRPILPTPHRVMEAGEPSWHGASPRSAMKEMDSTERHVSEPSSTKVQPPPVPQVRPVEKGQTREGTMKKFADGSWAALFEGDSREAMIVNQSKIPSECAEGVKAEFYITEQSKKVGIKARFEKFV
jgi:CRISPR-associated protein (TIGR03986 family)